MVGNVWEWTSSRYEAYPGGQVLDRKPGDLRVIRGGCYQSDKNIATVTFRLGWWAQPQDKSTSDGKKDSVTNYEQTGFRCVKEASTFGQN